MIGRSGVFVSGRLALLSASHPSSRLEVRAGTMKLVEATTAAASNSGKVRKKGQDKNWHLGPPTTSPTAPRPAASASSTPRPHRRRHGLRRLLGIRHPHQRTRTHPRHQRTARQVRHLRHRNAGVSMNGRSVVQDWVAELPMMQQTVLLTAVRGPDGLPKYHPTKFVLRWYRRCILLSAMDGRVLADPIDPSGGSFTGPSGEVGHDDWRWSLDDRVTEYLRALDEVPHHFQLHLMHAVEILGYKHPDLLTRDWWHGVYVRLVHDMHLWPETEEQLDARLSDSREGWLARGDVATND
jgi:hypothetical protein